MTAEDRARRAKRQKNDMTKKTDENIRRYKNSMERGN